MRPIPKLAVGDQWPGDEDPSFVVRLRNPFILARVEPRGLGGFRLHCWPAGAQDATTPHKLAKSLARMGEFWSREVEFVAGLPGAWEFVFDTKYEPPLFLVLDHFAGEWTGILRTREPLALFSVHSRGLEWLIEPVPDFGEPPCDPAALLLEVEDYWLRFCRAEASQA